LEFENGILEIINPRILEILEFWKKGVLFLDLSECRGHGPPCLLVMARPVSSSWPALSPLGFIDAIRRIQLEFEKPLSLEF
jgi:hypothetical protein